MSKVNQVDQLKYHEINAGDEEYFSLGSVNKGYGGKVELKDQDKT